MRPARPRWVESREPGQRSGVTCGVCCPSRRRRRSPASIWARWWCWTSTPRWSLRTRRRSRPPRRSRAGSVSTRSACGATTLRSCCRSACGRATPAVTTPGTTSTCWAGRSPRSQPVIAGTCWFVPTGPAPPMTCWTGSPSKPRSAAAGWSTRSASPPRTRRITTIPERVWTPAITADGEIREGAEVAEVTGLVDLRRWPAGMRVIVRRERPHPGAQLSLLEEADGWRYQAFATNTRVGQLAFLEARHRAHARVEDRIKAAKDTGLGRFPSREYAINQAWLQLVALAADLTAWLRLLALTGDLAVVEPKLLRFKMLQVPARLSRSGRRRQLRLPRHWPWAGQILEAFHRIMIIPAPT